MTGESVAGRSFERPRAVVVKTEGCRTGINRSRLKVQRFGISRLHPGANLKFPLPVGKANGCGRSGSSLVPGLSSSKHHERLSLGGRLGAPSRCAPDPPPRRGIAHSLNGEKSDIIPPVYMVDCGRAGGERLHPRGNGLPAASWPRRWRTERPYKKNVKRGFNHVAEEPFVSNLACHSHASAHACTGGDSE